METEKRIGDFRVNRKVTWGITFPQNLHTGCLIQISPFWGSGAGFVHSFGVECRTPFPQPPDPLGQSLHGRRVLVAKPAVGGGWRPGLALRLVEPAVTVEDDLFHFL